jgi:hypothetical protein
MDKGVRHEAFERSFLNMLPDLRPSSFLSASLALHSQIDELKANNIENISQLTGILSILPSLGELPRIVSRLANRDLSAIPELVTFLSEAWLKFSFDQKPTATDSLELLRSDIQGRLDNILKSRFYTSYGEFHYVFQRKDNPFGDGDLKLSTRTKVRFYVDLTTLMASYLSLNAAGMVPTLSNLWDLVPFSFVVDWFTQMGDRIKAVDDQLLWLGVVTEWCLHSYTLTYYPTDEELLEYGLANIPGTPSFGLKAYRREFSRLVPTLRDSKYDFFKSSPGLTANPWTVAAFTWLQT